MENLEKNNELVMVHHDLDGVTRDFSGYCRKLFYEKHPEYEQYQLPPEKVSGWWFIDEFSPPDKAKEIDSLIMKLFFGGELTYEVFRNAPALVTPDQWENHVKILKEKIPNSRIVVSTTQFTLESKIATVEWLDENKITHDDLIFTDTKDVFGAKYLLDDKPQTIIDFHNNGNVGVLMKRERSNGWYLRANKDIKFNMVDTIDEYRELILAKEKV
jgi:5'(3')-deoxyribonucleotidase